MKKSPQIHSAQAPNFPPFLVTKSHAFQSFPPWPRARPALAPPRCPRRPHGLAPRPPTSASILHVSRPVTRTFYKCRITERSRTPVSDVSLRASATRLPRDRRGRPYPGEPASSIPPLSVWNMLTPPATGASLSDLPAPCVSRRESRPGLRTPASPPRRRRRLGGAHPGRRERRAARRPERTRGVSLGRLSLSCPAIGRSTSETRCSPQPPLRPRRDSPARGPPALSRVGLPAAPLPAHAAAFPRGSSSDALRGGGTACSSTGTPPAVAEACTQPAPAARAGYLTANKLTNHVTKTIYRQKNTSNVNNIWIRAP